MANLKSLFILFTMVLISSAILMAMDAPRIDTPRRDMSEISSVEFDLGTIVVLGIDKGWDLLKNYYRERGLSVKSIIGSIFSCGYHGAIYPSFDMNRNSEDSTRHDSRKCVVDFFQENLINFYHGKKLLKIQYALAFEEDEVRNFYSDIGKVVTKTRLGTDGANAEIRMIYKLMNEIQDDDIKLLAKHTFEFIKIKKNQHGIVLEILKMPWEISPELWINRVRKNQSRYEFGVLSRDKYPQWILALLQYKENLKFDRPGIYPTEGTKPWISK